MRRNFQYTNPKFLSVPKTPVKNNRAPLQRPKKCSNCLKMIAANKYAQHCETCFRYKNEPTPVSLRKTTTNNTSSLIKNTSDVRNQSSLNPQKHMGLGKQSMVPNPQKSQVNQRKQSNSGFNNSSKFRIRETHQGALTNESKIPSKNSQGRKIEHSIKKKQEDSYVQRIKIQNKEQQHYQDLQYLEAPQIYKIERQQQEQCEGNVLRILSPSSSQISRRERKLAQFDHQRDSNNIDASQSQDSIFLNQERPVITRPHQQNDFVQNLQRFRQRQIQRQRQRRVQLQENQRIQQQRIRQRQRQRRSESLNQRQVSSNLPQYEVSIGRNNRPVLNEINSRAEVHSPAVESMGREMDQLISSTNDIIQFIENMGGSYDDQALQVMITQLRQLTHIAGQIRDLDNIGNNLGFRMGSVFARRIKELHATIINQIGITLIQRFHQRVGLLALSQFQSFLDRQPQLRTGFSKQQIKTIFPDKRSNQPVDCSICLEDIKIGGNIKQLQCHHKFHPDCIQHWLQASKQCPMCRTEQRKS